MARWPAFARSSQRTLLLCATLAWQASCGGPRAEAATPAASSPTPSSTSQTQAPSSSSPSSPSSPSSQSPSASAAKTPTYEQLVQAAASYIESGRTERAVDLLARAQAIDRERPEAYVVLGRALASDNKLDESAVQYEAARSRKSRDRRLFVELSSVYDVLERYDEALATYDDWLREAPDDAEMLHEKGLTLLLLERFDEAAAALARVTVLLPDDLQTQEDLGYAHLRGKRLADADAALTRVLARERRRPNALRLLAQVRAAEGRTNEAAALLDEALQIDPTDARAAQVRARLAQLLGNAKSALAGYGIVLKQAPDDTGALLGAAGALAVLDRLDEAASLLARVRAKHPHQPELRLRDAQLAWRRGDRAALGVLQALAKEQPANLEVWREIEGAAARFGEARLVDESRAKQRALAP